MSDRYGQLLASVVWVARRAGMGRLHSMASGSFRDAKLERPVSGAELRRSLVASRPVAVIGSIDRPTAGIGVEPVFRQDP